MGKPNQALFAFDNMFDVVLGADARVLSSQILMVAGLVFVMGLLLLPVPEDRIRDGDAGSGRQPTDGRAPRASPSGSTRSWGIGPWPAHSVPAGGGGDGTEQAFADVNMGFGVLLNGPGGTDRRRNGGSAQDGWRARSWRPVFGRHRLLTR